MVYRNKALQRESGKLCYRKSEDTDYGDCNDTDEYWFYYDGSGTGRENCAGLCLAVPYYLFYLWCKELQRKYVERSRIKMTDWYCML